jgi:hypothetical protein
MWISHDPDSIVRLQVHLFKLAGEQLTERRIEQHEPLFVAATT